MIHWCVDSQIVDDVLVVPLLSWHHATWDDEPDVVSHVIPPVSQVRLSWFFLGDLPGGIGLCAVSVAGAAECRRRVGCALL